MAGLLSDIRTRNPRMTKVGEEQRREERIQAVLPVKLGNGMGLTRDVSASGVYFETDSALAAGSPITFSVDIETPGGAMVLWCRGQVVRVDQRGKLQGIAVRIVESTVKAA